MMRRAPRALVLVAAGMVALTACTPDLPAVQTDPAPSVAPPVLSSVQDAAVYEAVGVALGDASTTLDPAELEPRLSGPALALRTVELQVAAAVGSTDGLTELPTTVQSEILPTTQTWPRTAMSVSVRPDDLGTERMYVLDQASARDQYKLWAWIRLFPSITLPTFAAPNVGTESVAPDDASLLMTPTDAVARYADVLTSREESAFAADFPDDPLRAAMADAFTKQSTIAQELSGTFTETYAAPEGALRAVRTDDGGALVVAQIDSTSTLTGEEGAVVSPNAAQRALIGDVPDSNSVSYGRTILVGIYVPPAEGGEIGTTVVGSEFLTTSASIP